MANLPEKTLPLSIVIVNFQTDDMVLQLLDDLYPNPSFEIILIDQSPENTLKPKLPKRPDVKFTYTGKNLGFSGGNNIGIVKATGEWIMLLNSDTRTSTNDILKLLEITKHNPVLVSAPKLIQPDSTVQNNVGFFDPLFVKPINAIFARPRFPDCSKIQSEIVVDLLTGAAMMIHSSVFEKIGMLDDSNFFMYFEDIDFSQRLHSQGLRVLYVPSIKIIHHGGASSDQNKRQKNFNYQQGLKAYLIKHRGYLIYFINRIFHFFQ